MLDNIFNFISGAIMKLAACASNIQPNQYNIFISNIQPNQYNIFIYDIGHIMVGQSVIVLLVYDKSNVLVFFVF